jgi:hypothetical protein
MGARRCSLDFVDQQRRRLEVYLIPPQVHQLGNLQAVPVGHTTIEALPFESLKLSATAILQSDDFAVRLERALREVAQTATGIIG